MHPILIKLGPLTVHSYGFLVALGFLAGILVSVYLAKKAGFESELIFDLALWVIIGAVLGARFFYVIGQWDYYKYNLVEIFMVQHGGLVFLGGLIFSVSAVVLYAKRKAIPLLKLLDVCTPGTALGYAIGRLGCFFNGCCFGLPTELPWGLVFPAGSLAHSYYPVEHIHPTQLYASASVFIVFIILLVLSFRKKFEGQVFFWGLILYSIYRFLVEFLRFSPIHWLGLTPSQWIVIFAFGFGIWGLIKKKG